MASDQINKILEAEQKAAQIEKDARVQADAVMDRAREQAVKDRENTLREAEDKARRLRADFLESDGKHLASVRAHAEESARSLRAKATPGIDSVVARTVDFIIGKE